jgi:small-conductance mechanosensitive channel
MGDKISNILNSIIKELNSYTLGIGSFKLSVLTIIKGLIVFIILYWSVRLISQFIVKQFKRSKRFSDTQKVLYLKIIKILLITIAIFFGLNIIGIDITTLAIFSSAVGFGIGFGLQKIFSNLISGIIILVDKSIQPGDVIAIGETYGEVVNLEARYVSIVTRDGKAHLVPNENLITEKVENWSYGNTPIRLKIRLGVAYESDLRLVEKLLIDAAKQHPRVILDPQPRALIIEFAPSTVNFELRVWIQDPQNGIKRPQSEIFFLIWDKFKEHKIEMPCPQREIKIRHKYPKEKLTT